MPSTEQADLVALRVFIATKKENAYALLRQFVNGDMVLRHCGYKSLEEATINIIRETDKSIEKAVRAHERKWPMRSDEE